MAKRSYVGNSFANRKNGMRSAGTLSGKELGRATREANRQLAAAKTGGQRVRIAKDWANRTGKKNSKQDIANIRAGGYKLAARAGNG